MKKQTLFFRLFLGPERVHWLLWIAAAIGIVAVTMELQHRGIL